MMRAMTIKALIIGAGAVGVEFASIFKRFGSDVTLLEMLPRIVPVEDEDVSKELEKYFRKQGIRIETGAKADNIQKTARGVKLTATLANGKSEQLEFDKLLIAVGRRPNTDKCGLESTKVELDSYTPMSKRRWLGRTAPSKSSAGAPSLVPAPMAGLPGRRW